MSILFSRVRDHHSLRALSGDGGDELFGGYNCYSWGACSGTEVEEFPLPWGWYSLRSDSPLARSVGENRMGRMLRTGLRASLHLSTLGEKIHKLAAGLDSDSHTELYRRRVSLQRETASLVIATQGKPIWADAQARRLVKQDFSEEVMFCDLAGYLTDDILTKADRAGHC